MKNEDKLKNLELAGKERYYYLKFPPNVRAATVYIIPYPSCSGPGYVRGVAFCNPLDQFNKRLGRAIALGRAIKAIERGEDSEPIPLNTPANILRQRQGIFFLSEFNVALSEFEQRIFSKTGSPSADEALER